MTFAHPEALPWLWALAGIPLLYLVRRRARTAAVPNLFLWERVLERRGRTPLRRIRRLLSIVLQVAIAAALVVAWAGPRRDAVTTVRVPVAVVVDTSLSMGASTAAGTAGTRLDAARALVEEELEALLGVGDVAVFAAAGAVVPVQAFSADAGAVRAALARVPAPGARFDVDAFRRWCEEQRRPGAAMHVVLVTDGATPGAEVLADLDVRVLRVGDAAVNAGLVDVSLEDTGGGVVRVGVAVAAVGGDATGTVIVSGEGGERAETPVTVTEDARLETSVDLELADDGPSWVRVRWVPDGGAGDALAADDVALVRRPPRQLLSVLVVAEEVDEHLTRALGVLPELVDRRAAAVVKPASWRRAAEGRDVVILCGVDERRPLPPGAYLLLGSTAPSLPLAFERAEGDVEVGTATRGERLLRGLDLRDLGIERARPVSVRDGAAVVLEGNTGALVARGERDGVRFVHTAFEVTGENTSLVLLPAWPLLVKDALEWLAPVPRRLFPLALSAGRPFAAARAVTGPVLASLDGGEERELRGAGGGVWLAPDTPGRWTLASADGSERLAVNVCDAEQTDVLSKLPAAASGPPPAPVHAPSTTDLTLWFIAAAVLLLLAEWLLYHAAWTQ